MYPSSSRNLHILNDGYRYSLDQNALQTEQPQAIKVELRSHQKAILYEMKQRELQFNVGLDTSGAKLFSGFGILGDGVGVGKSLMVLGHIASLKAFDPITKRKELTEHSAGSLYSIEERDLTKDVSNAGCLIVVPHTLYKQWENYIKTQTTLTYYGVKTKVYIEKERWTRDAMLSKDVVLVSNTLYGRFQANLERQGICWKRVFFDETDTLTIPSTQNLPAARFLWFISASWANLLLPNQTLYFSNTYYNSYIHENNQHLDSQMINVIRSWRHRDMPNSSYFYLNQHFHMVSFPFFRYYLGSSNRFRGRLVLRCRDEFIQESISLPPLYTRTILCRPTIAHRVVANAISADIRQLLHAGDYSGALTMLGVREEDSISLVQAVTENRLKELDRLKKTYDFKASIEYATPQAKEVSLKHLKQKIDGLEEQIKTLRERVENYKDEICPICFDEPSNVVMTNCCHRIFCAACILNSLTRMTTCPLCRSAIQPNQLRSLTNKKSEKPASQNENPAQPLRKSEQLVKLLQETLRETPEARFLIFSRFDNPLHAIDQDLAQLKIRAQVVQGNKDVIAKILTQFEKGDTRVLLLNSVMAGAGMNITSATHVILLHAMAHEEEKQILGRAYRMGRQGSLQMIRLLHPDELSDTHQISA